MPAYNAACLAYNCVWKAMKARKLCTLQVPLQLVVLLLALSTSVPVSAQEVGEPASEEESHKTWIVHAGVGSSKAWNFVGVTKEFPIGGRTALFLAGGYGTILVGGGVVFYTNRDGNGLVASATAGLAGAHASLGGQLKLFRRGYLTAGGSVGSYFLQHRGALPYISFEYRF